MPTDCIFDWVTWDYCIILTAPNLNSTSCSRGVSLRELLLSCGGGALFFQNAVARGKRRPPVVELPEAPQAGGDVKDGALEPLHRLLPRPDGGGDRAVRETTRNIAEGRSRRPGMGDMQKAVRDAEENQGQELFDKFAQDMDTNSRK